MTAQERKEFNLKKIEEDSKKYAEDIRICINNSDILEDLNVLVTIENADCISCCMKRKESRITVLNFASYSNPGGGFVNGSFAQEESLCGDSFLYNILSSDKFKEYYKYNREHKSKGLYSDRAIFTPRVTFHKTFTKQFNVLTCAAPNYKMAISNGISEDAITQAYEQRLRKIYQVLQAYQQDLFVAGAWGCGVFGFPLDTAIKIFKNEATIKTVLAIPKSKEFIPKLGTKLTEY